MQLATVLSFAAVFVSLGALGWSVWSWRRIEFRARAHENLKLMMAVEAKLADNPSALRFHGIEEAELAGIGLTVQEFIYLVQSFSAAQAFYEFETTKRDEVFLGDDYRAVICANASVQRAWPYVRRFMDDTVYRDRLDKTFRVHEPAREV